jgi:cell division protein FtsB
MRNGNRSVIKIILSSPITLVLAGILFIILAKAAWNIYQKADESAAKLSEADAGLAKLEDRQADLSAQVGYLSTPAGVEAELRTKYRAVKDGESVAVIIDDTQAGSTTGEQASSTLASWWRRLLHAVGL